MTAAKPKPHRPHAALPLHMLLARPRLLSASLFGAMVGGLAQGLWALRGMTAFMLGWNAGALLYLLLAAHMMYGASEASIRRRALQEDVGQRSIMALVVMSSITCLLAIALELSAARELHGALRAGHAALAALTILSSWLFTQTMFALHYAHTYFVGLQQGGAPGLIFPGDATPDYADFFYFSAVIGTSAQTADVSLASRQMRRIGTVHCILSFLFNTTVLALMINILAGLL
ncbi:DUF1345 domain-containing protein [Vogesella oryzae]|uniref:DUF1345 domain-containing protein n=1 Tax=Vogesella oryzae TaxID=1735285 RepID=UPI0015836B3E|nr:DUF1345 domain-containing protein [Vogesella oryzae]